MPLFRQQSSGTLGCAVIIAWAVIWSQGALGAAGQPFPRGDERPFVGCGKARALAQKHLVEQMRSDWREEYDAMRAAGLREAFTDTDLLHCDLEIELFPDEYENLAGTCTLTVQSKSSSLTQFTFRLREQYDITSATVDGTPVSVAAPSTTTRVATLDRAYGMDETFHLTIVYDGHAESRGFGSIEFTSHGGSDIVYTLSEAYFSYTWWPAKDGDFGEAGDNGDKFTLDLAVVAPDPMVTASNGVLEGVDALSGNRNRYRWSSDYPICPYLVCFSSTNYNTYEQSYSPLEGGSMPVLVYVYPESDTPANRAAWFETIDMMYTLRDLFGEYPFVEEKYGVYECEFGGGMEHQTFTAQGTFNEHVTVHELGHQWWGDMITTKTWNHIWLNEGFASYTEALWEEFKPGSSGLPALKSYMAGMAYTGGGSVYVTDDELDDMSNIFNGNTSYDKGAWVLHMLRHVLGDDDFFAALAAYRAAFEFSAATTEDLQAICENFYAGGDLEWFFQEWIYGERAPAYSWGWDTVEIDGQDYLLISVDQTQLAIYQRFTMPIDIVADGETYVVFNDADPEHFVIPVPSSPTSVSLDPDAWILWSSRTSTSYAPGPPTIVATAPSPGEILPHTAGLDTVSVTFHTNVNTASSHFSLVGAQTGPRSFTIASTNNVNPVVLQFDSPLPPDSYTLTVTDGLVAADSGMALDGEIADSSAPSSFPSGDGEPGGEAVIQFVVTGDQLGDFDDDGDVDLDDYAAFVSCYTGPNGGPVAPECQRGDFDLDDDVDCFDWDQFLNAWTAGGDPPDFEPCQVVPPASPPSPHDTPKNRYLTIDPTTNLRPVAYAVEVTESVPYPTAVGRTWWIDAPVCFDRDGHACPGEGCILDPVPPDCAGNGVFGWVAELGPTPVKRLWTEHPVHITGCGMVPVVTYAVRASSDEGATFSDPLQVRTVSDPEGDAQSWGDVTEGPDPSNPGDWLPPDGAMNFGDIGACIRTFENRTEDTGFPPPVRADVEINQVVNLGDIQFLVMAFEGMPYGDINLPLIGVHPFDCP